MVCPAVPAVARTHDLVYASAVQWGYLAWTPGWSSFYHASVHADLRKAGLSHIRPQHDPADRGRQVREPLAGHAAWRYHTLGCRFEEIFADAVAEKSHPALIRRP